MPEAQAPGVRLRGVTKVYGVAPEESWALTAGTRAAVDDVTLEIGEGTRLGIVGRNGAGKSTLVHLIAGIAEPSRGEVEVRGHVSSIMTLGVGLREEMSGRDNIYVDGEIQGRTREEMDALIDGVVAFADLGEFIDYPVRTYSTGMKARLAFAMISYLDPEILVIDEALSAGDARFSRKAAQKIREICQRGKIVILVSHSMAAIREICNRCIWMQDGRVIMDGTPGEVTEAYLDAVRRADESVILERYRSLSGSRVVIPGYEIAEMELIDESAGVGTGVIERGADLTVRGRLQAPPAARDLRLRLQIHRLDGLRIVDEVRAVAREAAGWPSVVEVGMRPCLLGPGTFHVSLSLLEQERLAATHSVLLECISRLELIGGRPALTVPVEVGVTRREEGPTEVGETSSPCAD